MGWTKRQFITQAFEEIGLASYVFDIQSDQLESALRRLDSMMATWNGKGIRLGYPIPASPENSDLDEETNVPDAANEAIYLNLGVRIAPAFGKTVPLETKKAAKEAYDGLIAKAVQPREMQFPGTLPLGAGNKGWTTEQVFVSPPDLDPIRTEDGGYLDFIED